MAFSLKKKEILKRTDFASDWNFTMPPDPPTKVAPFHQTPYAKNLDPPHNARFQEGV